MKTFRILFLLLASTSIYAHQPNLSSLMIYEQNGKNLVVLKSSLTAFQGEIDYRFKKNAYQSPEEFIALTTQHFQDHCLLIVDKEAMKLSNIRVILGHETTVLAEMENMPDDISSLYIKNTFFQNMPQNMSEVILTTKGISQKQMVLTNENNHEVNLHVLDQNWIVDQVREPLLKKSNLILGGSLMTALFLSLMVYRKKRKIE